MSSDWGDIEREIAERKCEEEAALPGFDRWRKFLHLAGFGWDVTAFKRLVKAREEIDRFRRANRTYDYGGYEREIVAIRVAADTFANQIEAEGFADHDPVTLRWVIAGLRCPQRPFCAGCDSCQSVIAPERAASVESGQHHR